LLQWFQGKLFPVDLHAVRQYSKRLLAVDRCDADAVPVQAVKMSILLFISPWACRSLKLQFYNY
jgi:hypothetical protein